VIRTREDRLSDGKKFVLRAIYTHALAVSIVRARGTDQRTEQSLRRPENARVTRPRMGRSGHGRITKGQVVDVTGANRNTVKKHMQMLVSASHLVQHGSGKAIWYSRV
jgi:hypothetical protein